MARDDRLQGAPAAILTPQVSLLGSVDEAMAQQLRDALADPGEGDEPFTVELTTLGGGADIARRMVLEVDQARGRFGKRRLMFLGKTVVYSAGVTFMAAFPRADRFLTRDARLLIHCRQLERTIELQGPIRASKPMVQALLHEFETGIALEVENFERLIEGSDVAMDELLEKALYNWYLTAEEAVERGLVAGFV
jgi:hypothetical protein